MTTEIDLNRPFSSAEFKRVKAVRFTVFDAETIQGFSVAEIYETMIYGPGGAPLRGGVNDPRLGPIARRATAT